MKKIKKAKAAKKALTGLHFRVSTRAKSVARQSSKQI